MKYLENFDEFINEKRVTVKRKYTDRYPARKASTSARVRNAVFDAMQDGQITEEELSKILSELSANDKKWMKRNIKLFNISEDEEGITKYRLSKLGNRIYTKTRQINED